MIEAALIEVALILLIAGAYYGCLLAAWQMGAQERQRDIELWLTNRRDEAWERFKSRPNNLGENGYRSVWFTVNGLVDELTMGRWRR